MNLRPISVLYTGLGISKSKRELNNDIKYLRVSARREVIEQFVYFEVSLIAKQVHVTFANAFNHVNKSLSTNFRDVRN